MTSSLERPDGTPVTKANVQKSTETITYVTIEEDLYLRQPYNEFDTKNPRGKKVVAFAKAGRRLTQSAFDALFAGAKVGQISPSSGNTTGGALVTVIGADLDGVTGVKVGGANGTNLKVLSPSRLTFNAPAGTAGAKDVALTDDSGTVTVTGGFTYTA